MITLRLFITSMVSSFYICTMNPSNEHLDHSIADLRQVYQKKSLSENEVDRDPIVQLKTWWNEAVAGKIYEPNAMTLSTCVDSKPSSRIVLLKSILDEGILFFTNYESRKGREIKDNPNVSVLFFWEDLERQVRIEGVAERASSQISDEYFQSRPRGSQIGAWASPQSEKVESREELDEKEKYYENYFTGKEIPRPEHWGGYLIRPQMIEFWQGRPSRLHDRIVYQKEENAWKIFRLAP